MAKKVISFRIDEEDIEALKAMAEKHVRPLSSEISYIIRKAKEEDDKYPAI